MSRNIYKDALTQELSYESIPLSNGLCSLRIFKYQPVDHIDLTMVHLMQKQIPLHHMIYVIQLTHKQLPIDHTAAYCDTTDKQIMLHCQAQGYTLVISTSLPSWRPVVSSDSSYVYMSKHALVHAWQVTL